MFKTPLTDLLGIETPIIGGTMMDLSTAPFVAAISNAGALGLIASAIYKDTDSLREEIKKTHDLTDKPFGVNINLFPMLMPPDNKAFLDVLAEEGVKIIETSGFGIPDDMAAYIKELGFKWMHKCVGVRYALTAQRKGADMVTVVGYENGGATGNLNVTTMVLVPSVVDALDIPVIGGGGVIDGRGLYAVMGLGAVGGIVGTRFVLSDECPVHQDLKDALLKATELDTDIVMRSIGFAHRCWLNEPAKKTLEIEGKGGGLEDILPYVSGEAARKMFETGDIEAGTISVSQGIGLTKRIMPCKDIVAEIMAEAEGIHSRMTGMLG